MKQSSTLLAVTFAFALTAGSAYADDNHYALNLMRPSPPAAFASSSAKRAVVMPGSSAAPLDAMLQEWDRAGFTAPSKPAQARVSGQGGYVTSVGEYHAMVLLIRSAIRDSASGRDQDALGKIAKVRALLVR